MEGKDFYSLREVSEILGLSYQTVLNLVAKNYLYATRIGGQWRVSKKELNRFKNEGNLREEDNIDLISVEEENEDEID